MHVLDKRPWGNCSMKRRYKNIVGVYYLNYVNICSISKKQTVFDNNNYSAIIKAHLIR